MKKNNILGIMGIVMLLILTSFSGCLTSDNTDDSKRDVTLEDEEECIPKFGKLQVDLSHLNTSIGYWNHNYFIAYELPDYSILLEYNITLEKLGNWHGMNQVLFWMVDSDIPVTNREMYWLRKDVSTNTGDSWNLTGVEDRGQRSAGYYFIVGMTNQHHFEIPTGYIIGYVKVGCW